MRGRGRVVTGAMCLLLWSAANRAEAGDGPLEVTLVDMTPAAGSPATPPSGSKECLRWIDGKLPRGDSWGSYVVARRSESILRKQVGMTHGEPFSSWSASVLGSADSFGDTLILVDCRPAGGQLDVVVLPPSRAVVRIRLRRNTLDRSLVAWAMDEVLVRAWAGWVP